jgi:hypothetical protein
MVSVQEVTCASPWSQVAIPDHGPGRKVLIDINVDELKPVLVDLIREVLSNLTTWPGVPPATPAFPFGPATPPLNVDQLRKKLLVEASGIRSSQPVSDIEDIQSKDGSGFSKTGFKKVIEMYNPINVPIMTRQS